MTCNSIGASVVGSSHIKVNKPCQDHEIHDCQYIAGHECFYGFASDGAGSSTHSKVGAALTCMVAERFILEYLRFDTPIDENLIYQMVQAIVAQLKRTAAHHNIPLRQYRCTFLGTIYYQDTVAFFQIGDGAILVNPGQGDSLRVVFWPENGEYVNTTHFVGDDNSAAKLRVKVFKDFSIKEIAILTDGLQMLCLDYKTHSAYEPFFRPLFNVLKQADNAEKIKILNRKLAEFLAGNQVNARTDDDKTLILATFE